MQIHSNIPLYQVVNDYHLTWNDLVEHRSPLIDFEEPFTQSEWLRWHLADYNVIDYRETVRFGLVLVAMSFDEAHAYRLLREWDCIPVLMALVAALRQYTNGAACALVEPLIQVNILFHLAQHLNTTDPEQAMDEVVEYLNLDRAFIKSLVGKPEPEPLFQIKH